MSVRLRLCLSLALAYALPLMGACGAEGPDTNKNVGPSGEDEDEDDGDTDSSDDGTEDEDTDSTEGTDEGDEGDAPEDDEDDSTPPPTPRDSSVTVRMDAGGGRDSGTTSVDSGTTTRTDSGTTTPRADSGTTGGADGGGTDGRSDGGSSGGPVLGGDCCPDKNCICREPPSGGISASRGKYRTATMRIGAGTVYYPTDAEAPFAAVAVCGGFLNTGPEMNGWGTFYASHGIVTVITSTGAADIPDIRASKLRTSIMQLKAENTKAGSMLNNKLAGRYGTSGYSMGGGGTSIAASQSANDDTFKTSVGLAPWSGTGRNTKAASLMLCGSADTVAPCLMAQSIYSEIPASTPKTIITFSGATHFNWFGPGDAGRGGSGGYALAWQKTFLEGDERWKSLLTMKPGNTSGFETNVK